MALVPSLLTLGVALLPWAYWVATPSGRTHPAWRTALAYGGIPGVWLAALATLEALGNPVDVSTAVLAAAGICAHLGAALHLDRLAPPLPGLILDRSGRDGLATTRRRATLRHVLLTVTALAFSALLAWATDPDGDASPLEHTFAVVIIGMLGASVVLLVLPRAMRRTKAPPDERRSWPRTVLLAFATIAIALGLEYWTR